MATKKRKKRAFYVHLQLHAHGVRVKAHSEAEAKRIAFARIIKRSYGFLVDKNNTSAEKDYYAD